jgi:ubiquinone/menaquinone biosynthesis C-methylase UbiE
VERPQSGFGFRMMSLMFRFRDLLKPRGNIVKEVGLKLGSRVLDFGCGPGGYILPVEKLIGPSGKVYALDVNLTALNAVKSLAAKHHLTNIETIQSDMATGLPDGSIDIALLYDVLHHLKNPDAVLAELHRVLQPEGMLSVSDHHLEDDNITSRISAGGLFRLARKGKVHHFTRI